MCRALKVKKIITKQPMFELRKTILALIEQGYAPDEKKQEVEKAFNELTDEERDVLQADLDKVKELPSESKKNEEDVDELEKGIKSIVKATGEEVKAELKNELVDEIKSFMKEHEEEREKKAGIYHKDVKKDQKVLSDKIRATVKAVLGNEDGDAKLKEMSTDSTGSPYAGYVVDSELNAEIQHLVTEYGVAAREMFNLTLSKNSYKTNTLVTDVSVSWTDEAGSIGSTRAVLGQKELTLNKLTAIATLTSELIEDEEIPLFRFLAERVAEGFAEAEDKAFFNGDGTGTYGDFTGILQDGNVNTVTMSGTTFASIDADDLIDMVDETPQGALRNAKFYMNRTIMSYVRKLKDDDNVYIYQSPSERGPATIWGYPVVLVEAMPDKDNTAANTAFVLFGDLRKAAIYGHKGQLKAKRFDAGVVRNVDGDGDINLITSDREAIRWTKRVGYVLVIPTAVTRLRTATSG